MQGSQFISLIFLAYHLITKVPAKTLLEKRAVFEKPDPSALPVGDPELLSGDVVFNMVVHWKNEMDLLEKLCTSLFLLNVLQATNYLTEIEDPETGLETLAFNIQVSDLIKVLCLRWVERAVQAELYGGDLITGLILYSNKLGPQT